MAKNIFDGLSPLAAFATKLFSAAGLDLAALHTAGNADALKLHLESLTAKSPDLAAAITQATEKLSGEVTSLQSKLDTAIADHAIALKTHTTRNAALLTSLSASGITIPEAAFVADKPDDTAAALKTAIDTGVAKSARLMVTKAGLPPLPEDFGTDPVSKKKEKTKAELNAERDGMSAEQLLRRDFNAQLKNLGRS